MTVQPTRDQLRALANAAMPAPWEADRDESDGQMVVFVDVEGSGGPVVCTDLGLTQADAEFIAAARTAFPALLDALDQAEARIQAVRSVLDRAEAAINRHPAYTFSAQRLDPIVNGADIRRALDGE